MVFSGPVASLAPLPLRSLMLGQRRLPVRASVETLAHVFMTGFARVGTNVLRRIFLMVVGVLWRDILGRSFLFGILWIATLGFIIRGFSWLARRCRQCHSEKNKHHHDGYCQYLLPFVVGISGASHFGF